MKRETYKLKKGDMVYVKLPMNAKIIRVNKKYGYTLRTSDGAEWCYFGDDECELVGKKRGATP